MRNDPGEEVIHDNILVVEADELLDGFKIQARIIIGHPVVHVEHQPLQLRHQTVFIVAGVADDCSSGEARQIVAGLATGPCHCIAVAEAAFLRIHVRLVGWTPAVDIIQIKARRAEIHEPIGIQRFTQGADGSNVMS